MSDDIFDLLRGGKASELMVKRELERMQARFTEHWGDGFYYAGRGDFLLEHGTTYQGKVAWPTPDKYKPFVGPNQWCYRNSLDAARANPELRYCEGVYMVGSTATPHAWCLTPDDEVLELTLGIDDLNEVPPEARRVANKATGTSHRMDLPETWVYIGHVFTVDQVGDFAYTQWGYAPDQSNCSIPVLDDGFDEDGTVWSGEPNPIFRRPWKP